MVNRKLLSLLSLLFISMLLLSCGGTTDREWSIENQSSSKISFTFKKHIYPYDIGGSLEKGEYRIVDISSEDKADMDPMIPYDVFSEMTVINENGESMKKDWQNNQNWEIYIEETETSPSKQLQTYRLVVKDADF